MGDHIRLNGQPRRRSGSEWRRYEQMGRERGRQSINQSVNQSINQSVNQYCLPVKNQIMNFAIKMYFVITNMHFRIHLASKNII